MTRPSHIPKHATPLSPHAWELWHKHDTAAEHLQIVTDPWPSDGPFSGYAWSTSEDAFTRAMAEAYLQGFAAAVHAVQMTGLEEAIKKAGRK